MPSSQGLAYADFAGLSSGLDQLLEAYSQRKAPQSLLLSGPKGLLKKELALFLARSYLCQAEEHRPCGSCGACQRLLSGSHQNLIELGLGPKDKSIKIDQLRGVLHQLGLNPLGDGARFVLVSDIDLMTVQAQNALLKSLEEPDPGNYFVLTSSNEPSVLSTILSRCRIQRLLPWPDERIDRFLSRQGVDKESRERVIGLAGGRPGRAMQMIDDPGFEALRAVAGESFLDVRELTDIPEASARLKDYRESAGPLLDILEAEAARALSARQRNLDEDTAWPRATPKGLRRLIEEIYKARSYLNSNVSWQGVADRLLLLIVKEIT